MPATPTSYHDDRPDAAARRAFWAEHLDRADRLMQTSLAVAVADDCEPLASIPDAARAAGVAMSYSTSKNAGKFDRIYAVRQGLIDPLMAAAAEMNERGWRLHMEEGFRTREMQTALGRMPAVFDQIVRYCQWETQCPRPDPELVFRRARCLVAILPRTGTHLMGAAIDISVFRRDDDSEVWRGGPYLEMSERTPMCSPYVDAESQQNRQAITVIMERHGFMHYPGEYWHYNSGDSFARVLTGSDEPARYGPVELDPQTGRLHPWRDPETPLTSPKQFRELLDAAIARVSG